MIGGRKKAVTFSFDDGSTQDQRLICLLNKYDLKCTFNLNSELLGRAGSLVREGVTVAHVKPRAQEVRGIYEGHEVAVHTLTHPLLPDQPDEEVIRQVECDRQNLSELVGYEVVGMAYPCGGANHNERVARLIEDHTGVKYARTVVSTESTALQSDLYRFHPTCHVEWEGLVPLAKAFLESDPKEDMLLYVWGHSFEFDIHNTWDRFEDFCRLISRRGDVFYGTNRECFGL